MPEISLPISQDMTQMIFYVALTLLGAIILDSIFRSLIKIPKHAESRHTRVYLNIFQKIITIIIYIIALYFISLELGINITPLLASASVIGIVVGIGARPLIEDLISGFFMLTQDSIAEGDYVRIEDAEGIVDKLGFRSITIRGDSGELYIIPNGHVKKIVNFSRHKSYMNIDFPVKADQNIDKAIEGMNEALDEFKESREFIASIYPGSEVLGIEEFRPDGRIVLRTKIVTLPENRLRVSRSYRYLVKKQFEKHKIGLV